MADCSQPHMPLVHGGTSQRERNLLALSPAFVQIDDSREADWILFASQFSKLIAFYADDGREVPGGWGAFFNSDISAILGTFAIQNVERLQAEISTRLAVLRDDESAESNKKHALSEILSAIVSLALGIQDTLKRIPAEHAFRATLDNMVRTRLRAALLTLLGHLRGAGDDELNLYVTTGTTEWRVLGQPIRDAWQASSELGADWFSPSVPSFAHVQADKSIYFNSALPPDDPSRTEVFAQLRHAANHFLFHSALDAFVKAYAQLVQNAEQALLRSLESDNTHAPHYALFLAFLRLYRHATQQLNLLAGKHLDFYYRDVLRLEPRPAEPDHAFLIAQLAKRREVASLPEGALFVGNKDSARKERLYALERETTFNRAEVASLMAVYRTPDFRQIYAAPVINSADGQGAKLDSELRDFHPFVVGSVDAEGVIATPDMPAARLGFAVSSYYLFLDSGRRSITLIVQCSAPVPKTLHGSSLLAKLSHPKGWLSKPVERVEAERLADKNVRKLPVSTSIALQIELDASDPPITAVDPNVHGMSFKAGEPALQIELVTPTPMGIPHAYASLGPLAVETLKLKVRVGMNDADKSAAPGTKSLVMVGKNGALDPSKPLMPWGPTPEHGDSFAIGSTEAFSKPGAKLRLDVAWRATTDAKKVLVQFLHHGSWVTVDKVQQAPLPVFQLATQPISVSLFAQKSQNVFTELEIPSEAQVPSDAGSSLTPETRGGFVRLVLDGDFGHSTYAVDLTRAMMKYQNWLTSNSGEEPAIPGKPYVPIIEALSCSYHAETKAVDPLTEDNVLTFYHVGPFGIAPVESAPARRKRSWLVPQLRAEARGPNSVSAGFDQAQFYIGLSQVQPAQVVQLLVQVLEGSSAPLLSKPDVHVRWSFWSDNGWLQFLDDEISDSTRQLTQTGLVRFQIPKLATTDRGIMPHGNVWLCASVKEHIGAVCRLLGVFAQACEVTFEDHGNAADAVHQVIPASTIKKLKVLDANFKAFEQPYASFGGGPAETQESFYLHSSERLRHKGRAVTIWDYERLILAAFPEIHRAKCLHHTKIIDDPSAKQAVHNENAVGHVSVITIPRLEGRNDTARLKPYTPQHTLAAIRDFLLTRVSGQLAAAAKPRIFVCNPLFEEVAVELRLQLRPDYDDFNFYAQRLVAELTEYLAPWLRSDAAEPHFGGRLFKSVVVNFIEEREYVDYIADVVLKHRPHGADWITDGETVEATTARSVLVPAEAKFHRVQPYQNTVAP